MRVEVTFAGDSVGAQHATDQVNDALKKLILTADATGASLGEVRITSGQTAETVANARTMKREVESVGTSARRTRDDLLAMRLAGAGGGGGGFPGGLLGVGLAAGVPLIGPVGGAALAGIAALPGLAATGSAAIGVLALSFNGLGKAVGGNRQAFEALDPQAQAFVQTLRSLDGWIDQLQETARGGLLPGLTDGLHAALTPANAQAIQAAIGGIAKALGDVGAEFGKSIGSPEFTRGFGVLMQHGATWTREFGDATLHLAGAMGKLAVAALPLTDWLVKTIDEGSRLLDNWTAMSSASGALAQGLASARHELQIVAGFVGALGGALFSLGRALTPLANEILVGLTHALQDLADWIDRNRQAIVDFSQNALHGFESILNDIVPLVQELAASINAVVSATSGWKVAFEIMTVGWLAKSLSQVKLLRLGLLALASPEVLAAIGVLAIANHSGKITPETVISATYKGKTLQATVGTGAGDTLAKVNAGKKLNANDINVLGSLGAQAVTAKGAGLQLPSSFTATHDTLGADWVGRTPGPDAVDLMASPGTPLKAPEDGRLTRISGHDPSDAAGSASHGPWGRSFYYVGDSGTVYYGTHLSDVSPIGRYKKGDVIAIIGAYPGGGSHVHWAIVGSGAAALGDANMPSTQFATLAKGSGGSASPSSATTPAGGPGSPFGTPPAFEAGKKANILPANIRLAMALATTTGGAGDNLAATRDAVSWLRAQISAGAFQGEDLINAATELGALLQQVNSLRKTIAGPKSKRGPALASAAAGISAQSYARGLLGTLGTDVFSATPLAKATADTQAAMKAALTNLDQVEANYKPRIEKIAAEISKGLATKTLTASDLATLRARMTAYGTTITTAVQNAKTAVAAQQQSFSDVWSRMASAAIDAFNAQSAKFVPPSQLLLNQLNDAKNKQDLADALTAANKQMADALNSSDPSQTLDAVRSTVGRYALANAVDVVQSAVLGGTSTFGSGAMGSLLTDLQNQLVQQTVPDAQAVKDAQKAIDDAQFNIRTNDLAAQAVVEQNAYDDMRKSQLTALQQMAGDWAIYYNQVAGNINAIKGLWVAALGALDPTAAAALGGAVGSTGQPVGAAGPAAIVAAATTAAVQAAQSNIFGGAQSSFQWGGRTWANGDFGAFVAFLSSTGVDYSVWARNHQAAASVFGRDTIAFHAAGGVATRSTFIGGRDVMGEAGAEALLPLSNPRAMQMIADAIGPSTVELHGDLAALEPFVKRVIRRNTPGISRSLGERTANRLKSNTFGGR